MSSQIGTPMVTPLMVSGSCSAAEREVALLVEHVGVRQLALQPRRDDLAVLGEDHGVVEHALDPARSVGSSMLTAVPLVAAASSSAAAIASSTNCGRNSRSSGK